MFKYINVFYIILASFAHAQIGDRFIENKLKEIEINQNRVLVFEKKIEDTLNEINKGQLYWNYNEELNYILRDCRNCEQYLKEDLFTKLPKDIENIKEEVRENTNEILDNLKVFYNEADAYFLRDVEINTVKNINIDQNRKIPLIKQIQNKNIQIPFNLKDTPMAFLRNWIGAIGGSTWIYNEDVKLTDKTLQYENSEIPVTAIITGINITQVLEKGYSEKNIDRDSLKLIAMELSKDDKLLNEDGVIIVISKINYIDKYYVQNPDKYDYQRLKPYLGLNEININNFALLSTYLSKKKNGKTFIDTLEAFKKLDLKAFMLSPYSIFLNDIFNGQLKSENQLRELVIHPDKFLNKFLAKVLIGDVESNDFRKGGWDIQYQIYHYTTKDYSYE